jgi:hypothetical protein
MDIFSFPIENINLGKIKCDDSRYIEVFNLEFELPNLECINGICQKMNPSVKKDIYFLDLKLKHQDQQEIISRLIEIENKIMEILQGEGLSKINFFYNTPITPEQIKINFKSSILRLDDCFYLRLKIPHDNIQFCVPIENGNSFLEDIKFGSSLRVTVECPGIWFSDDNIGLSWNISKIRV